MIGIVPMNLRSKTRARRDHGFMPICIAKKAMKVTLLIGTVVLTSLSVENRSMQSGSASLQTYLIDERPAAR